MTNLSPKWEEDTMGSQCNYQVLKRKNIKDKKLNFGILPILNL
jgi:hypothetical protein